MSRDYGFILTRHVTSELTNKYWNRCVKLIRTFYPHRQIVVIDDNSNNMYVKPDFPYKNLTVIQSEYPGRGEILPYIYYLRYKWFPNAVIIHDSLFIHRRIPFERFTVPVLPLWHHVYDRENVANILRISSVLTNSMKITDKIRGNGFTILGLEKHYNLCFGGQAFINLNFLQLLEQKYKISSLVHVIHNRSDRCALERILGILFNEECPDLLSKKSLFGDIFTFPQAFSYNYNLYHNDLKRKKVPNSFVKVWTGR